MIKKGKGKGKGKGIGKGARKKEIVKVKVRVGRAGIGKEGLRKKEESIMPNKLTNK